MKSEYGFTLIELVVVIIIVAIIGVFTLPLWRGTSIGLYSEAQRVANDIRYAQALGMTKGQRYRWVRTATNAYQIQDSAGSAIVLAAGGTSATFNTGITFGGFTNLPNNLINFDGLGTPYTDTSLPGTALASTALITLTSGSQTATISITPQTGGVTVQ